MKILKKFLNYMFFSNVRIRKSVDYLIRIKKKKKFKILQILIREHLRKKYHILLGENVIIGSLKLPHPHNIVIGRNVKIGKNCTIYHDVTIGQNLGEFPQIGSNVIIYTGARVIGGITIGDNAIIGANAVVTSDVPENAIVVGMPAKVIKYRSDYDEYH